MPNGSNGQPTITDVARHAGVSIKTVSRVVNNEPAVRDATRERVQLAIAELQYQPNPAARGLAGRRSFTIGVLYENPKEFGYLQKLLSGTFEACNEAGYTLVLCPCESPADRAVDAIRHFATQSRVDGVILPAPLGDTRSVTDLLQELGVPFVQISPKRSRPGWPAVQCNDRRASRQMTDYLLDLGHRRVGVILGHPDHGSSRHRSAGVRDSLRAHGLQLDPDLVEQGYFDFESGKACAARLLQHERPPTAIIAANDEMAAGAIHEAHERGLRVPQELSVVGFDNSPTASHVWPPLTTVRQPISEMATLATRLLIKVIGGGAGNAERNSLQCELMLRDSAATCENPDDA